MLSPGFSNPLQCGFLNRKTMTEPSGKRSKDRTWQTFWCQVKDGNMEFYKVQGVHVKGNFDPPPRDIYPPPNRQQHKVGFAVLEGAWVEVDLTSQKNKDLDKRRKFLFQVILSNDVEYLLQAPSQNQMYQWVSQLKRASITGEDGTFDMGDKSRIKTSRCSLNKRSKHNTNSVRATIADPIAMEEDVVDFPVPLLRELDPRLPLLRKRLQSKRELLKQLQKMLSSFRGDVEPLFRESDGGSTRRGHHRSSNTSIPGGGEREGNYRRSGTSESISSNSDGGRVLTTLVKDYYLLPGVEWTVLKEGETVEVTGRLSNGWYRCKAQRDARFRLDNIPTLDEATDEKGDDTERTEEHDVLGDIEEDEREKDSAKGSLGSLDFLSPDLLEPPSVNGNGINGVTEEDELGDECRVEEEDMTEREQIEEQDIELSEDGQKEEDGINESDSIDLSAAEEAQAMEEESNEDDYNAEDEDEEEASKELEPETFFRQRTSSYMQATLVNPVVKMRPLSLGRKDSYHLATSQGSLDMGEKQTRHLSYFNAAPSPTELRRLRVSTLIEHERANEIYVFPLVGAIPPSVLQAFTEGDQTHTRLPSSTSDYSSITPATDDNSSLLTQVSSSDASTIAETPSSTNKKELHENSAAQVNMSNHTSSTRSETGSIDIPTDLESTLSSSADQREKLFIESYSVDSSLTSLPSSLKNPLMTPPPTRKELRHLRSSSLPSSHPVVVRSRDGTKSTSQTTSPDIPFSGYEDDDTMTHEVHSPSRNGTLRIIPSPTSSPKSTPRHSGERRRSDGDSTKNSPPKSKNSYSNEKQRHSMDDGKSSKGLLHRFKKNVFGKKLHVNSAGMKAMRSPSPSPSPITPPRVRAVTRLQEEESVTSMSRARVSSISGKALHSKGMGVVFGESSSGSDSEEGHVRSRSSEGGSGGTPPSSIESSPVIKRRLNVGSGTLPKSPSPDLFHHGAVTKTMSTPLDTYRANHEGRTGSDPAIEDEQRGRKFAVSITVEGSCRNSLIETNITRYIKAPPRGVKRSVSVIPENNKYGFHLEGYEVEIDDSKIPRTIIRHIVPGSPAFVSGLYPGDCILEVNGKDTHHLPVHEIVSLIQSSTSQFGRVDLAVAFVDGVNRLDLLRKSEEVRTGLRQRQNKLDELIKQEREQCPTPSLSPTPSPTHILSRNLSLWSEATPTLDEATPTLYPHSSKLNSFLAVHHGDVSTLLCDLLVIPMRGSANTNDDSTDCVSKLLRTGGRELMDELSLADHCSLGKNLFTDSYSLTVQAICHCVFGQSEDHLVSCCRNALEVAYKEDYKTILFWVDAFIRAGAAPTVILETVRCWLEEGENSNSIDVIIFSMPQSPDLLQLMELYFPLTESVSKAHSIENGGVDSDDVTSASRTAIPAQTNGIPSSSSSTAMDSPASLSADPLSENGSSPTNFMSRERSNKEGITETAPLSSYIVTSVSDPNASVAWETVAEQGKAGGVQEKLSEFEAIVASISSHLSPKHHQ